MLIRVKAQGGGRANRGVLKRNFFAATKKNLYFKMKVGRNKKEMQLTPP
jgi:hypothetical protein